MAWLAELRKRKVFRVGAAYAVVGWLLVQVASVVLPALNLPPWTVTFTTVLLMLGFPVALLLAWSFDIVRAPGPPGAKDAASTAVVARSVVVLPFANMSEEAAQTHFAGGIVEDLTTRLQAIRGLKVLSRQSAFAYQGRSVDTRTISRELGCQYVVEGSVRKIDDRIRVTAQLIDAPKDEHVWAERYDRRLEDAFALQDEICDRIVAAIEARLAPVVTAGAAGAREAPAAAAAGAPAVAVTTPHSGPRVESVRQVLTTWWTLPAALALIALAGALTWTLQQRSRERWAREEALPRLEALIANDDYQAAFDLAAQVVAVIPGDPRLKSLESSYTRPIILRSSPAGAKVQYRPYGGTDADWRSIGRTPIENLPMPIGIGLWKLEHPGHVSGLFVIRNPSVQLHNHPDPTTRARAASIDFSVRLTEASTAPPGMVLVPATDLPIPLASPDAPVALPAFFIDRFEVTNREYLEFIEARGYESSEYWHSLPLGSLSADWRAAVARFVDGTGRPGPATWEVGRYPEGADDHPVTGVSWFEAAAYARFRGKHLPTAYHWYRAAFALNESSESLASAIVGASNFSGKGTARVGEFPGIGPWGTYDMAGNAREWLWNMSEDRRWVAGAAWSELPYVFWNQIESADPWNRSPITGFRCMRSMPGETIAAELLGPAVRSAVDFSALEPVSEQTYAVLAEQLSYVSSPSQPQVEPASADSPHWRRERITLPTGYDDTRFEVHLFLPSHGSPPYQAVFYVPHAGYTMRPFDLDDFDPVQAGQPLDFILKSGRALVVVAIEGSFDRHWPAERRQTMSEADRFRTRLRHTRQDLGRTIDYLRSRDDIDAGSLGWFGDSYGGIWMIPILAVETRFRTAVLIRSGVRLADLPPAEQPYNYAPRIKQPVLMLNGRWDMYVSPASQQRLFDLLGASPSEKRLVQYDAGHGILPQNQLVRETLDWFDRYLGPTQAN
jgi:TolB-like protein/formylglycine-generating enzyme required for sulfatase activity/dienelactone hydrolase